MLANFIVRLTPALDHLPRPTCWYDCATTAMWCH